jgi:hypothetical protein
LRMDLESQILKFLDKKPIKKLTIVEIRSGICRVKPSKMLLIKHYPIDWESC